MESILTQRTIPETRLMEELTKDLMFDDYPMENVSIPLVAWPTLKGWLLMDSMWPSVYMSLVYLVFVLLLGPNMMKSRQPFQLKNVMQVYNLVQVVFSLWLFLRVATTSKTYNYCIEAVISPSTHVIDEGIEHEISVIAWCYLISKYFEFLDTVFFVLRRKQNQVTFLHVYHHTNMAISTWFYVRYIRGSHVLFVAFVNTFVHAIMYGYYFLAALGPAVKPYLWWKKYITQLQLGQFVLILAYLVIMIAYQCPIQKAFAVYTLLNTSSFLILFYNFYNTSYRAKRQVKTD